MTEGSTVPTLWAGSAAARGQRTPTRRLHSQASTVFALGFALSASLAGPALGQEAESEAVALKVFVDCRSRFCDFDYLRREITFVNYVRDRRDAQVHLLVTTRRTGAGGSEFRISMIGQDEFLGVDDSLTYFSNDTDTFDEVRGALTRIFKLGLTRYAARLPMAQRLDVSYLGPDTLQPTLQEVEDPWNFWIFRVRVGSFVSGEERTTFLAGNASLSANRTTEEWKTDIWLSGHYSEDKFELSDSSTLTSIARDYGGGAFMVKSLGAHWSVGGVVELRASTFENYDLRLETGPAVEYSYFPYAESSRRALTVIYALQLRYFDYAEVTIFDETAELRPAHLVEASYSVRQPFGTIRTRLEAFAFLNNFRQHSIELDGFLNIRLVRGLELNLRGGVERTKDQINLARGGATDEEVLLRRRELGTEYRYDVSVSLSYTFGSIFNNIVNPRFD